MGWAPGATGVAVEEVAPGLCAGGLLQFKLQADKYLGAERFLGELSFGLGVGGVVCKIRGTRGLKGGKLPVVKYWMVVKLLSSKKGELLGWQGGYRMRGVVVCGEP